jgi:hypothetical protein
MVGAVPAPTGMHGREKRRRVDPIDRLVGPRSTASPMPSVAEAGQGAERGRRMEIPAATHPIWRKIVTGEAKHEFDHLGVQVFLGRAKILLIQDPSESTVSRLAAELHDFFVKNVSHPKLQQDVAKIAG